MQKDKNTYFVIIFLDGKTNFEYPRVSIGGHYTFSNPLNDKLQNVQCAQHKVSANIRP
jgi:hypothetical protein